MNDTATLPSGTLASIVRKELRDNLRWAVLCVLGLSAAYVWVLRGILWFASRDDLVPYDGAFAENFWGVTGVGSAIAGLLLGLAQTLPENHGDKWGFLAHRPVRRSTIFYGKAIAGLLLFVAAAGIPLAGTTIWVGLPGHLPLPFDWGTALPGVADVLSGIPYYFAGMLIGMRDARWYLSRTMGLGGAMICTFLVAYVRTFPRAIVSCSIAVVVIGAAAWGTFIAGGRYETQPRLARIATFLAVGPGIAIVGVVILFTTLSFLPKPIEPPYASYALSPEGQVVQTLRQDGQLLAVNDLSGQPVEQYKDPVARNSNFQAVDSAQVQRLSPTLEALAYTYRGTGQFFKPLRLRRAGNAGYVTWFYVREARLVAAYDTRAARLIGWLGPDGYSEGVAPPSQRFDGDLQGFRDDFYYGSQSNLLAFSLSVYRLDLDHYRIEQIYTAASGEQILGAASSYSKSRETADAIPFELIATTEKIVVQKLDGSPVLVTSPDPLISGMAALSVLRPLRTPGMPLFVWYAPLIFSEPDQVTEFNPAGAIVAQHSLPDQIYRMPVNWLEVTTENLVMPITGRAAVDVVAKILKEPVYGARNVEVRRVGWILPVVTGLISAAVAFLRTRSYAFPLRRSLVWTLIAFATGPFGLLTTLMLLEWPAREKCPACSKLRVVTSERCEHCAQPFSPPASDGTEIFETA